MFLLLSLLLVPSAAAQALPFSPRLAFGADPQTEMTIVWDAPRDTRTHRLEFGTTAQMGNETRATQRDLSPRAVWPVYAKLTGLTPDTEYHYLVRQGETRDEVRRFRTAPADNRSFLFVAWGDQGVPGTEVAAGMAPQQVTDMAARSSAAFGIVLGDLAYAKGQETTWNAYLQMVSPFASTRPLMAVRGNHEIDVDPLAYSTRLRMPSEDHDYYSFRYGSAVFIGLDTESVCRLPDGKTAAAPFGADECPHGANTEQTAFLEATLQAARGDPGVDWIVVYHHYGLHSKGKHGANAVIRDLWGPLYDKWDVDLVLQAHDHLYLRSHPLRAGKIDPEGTTYVVVGTGGANLYSHGSREPWEAAEQNHAHGLLQVLVSPDQIDGAFVATSGEVLDEFTIGKKAKALNLRPTLPIPAVDGLGLVGAVLLGVIVARRRQGDGVGGE